MAHGQGMYQIHCAAEARPQRSGTDVCVAGRLAWMPCTSRCSLNGICMKHVVNRSMLTLLRTPMALRNPCTGLEAIITDVHSFVSSMKVFNTLCTKGSLSADRIMSVPYCRYTVESGGRCHTSQLSVGDPGRSIISVAKAVAINFVPEIIIVRCLWKICGWHLQ